MTIPEQRDGGTEGKRDGEYAEQAASPNPSVSPSLDPSVSPSFLRQLWDKTFDDDVFGRAAQLAYYWLFSLFPLLIFLTALLAYLPEPIPRKLDYWLSALNNVLPADAYRLIDTTFHQVTAKPRGGLLSFSILIAIWASSAGMEGIIGSINRAYRTTTLRSWWREKLLAIVLTLGLAGFVLVALSLIFFGESIGLQIARALGMGAAFKTAFGVAQWPIVSILILIAVDLIYYFAPNIKKHRWQWFTSGAVFAVICWLLISFGFRYYVSRFGNYNATYGALGGVMVLMLWFYLTGVVILLGGEINALSKKI
ncbi:MAG: YihY/virulence factor BrkB family protein [Acidobacteriota bacterium]|nr:YihY/virulence factor BrkB family protein [Acidobacteriota bacterium]